VSLCDTYCNLYPFVDGQVGGGGFVDVDLAVSEDSRLFLSSSVRIGPIESDGSFQRAGSPKVSLANQPMKVRCRDRLEFLPKVERGHVPS